MLAKLLKKNKFQRFRPIEEEAFDRVKDLVCSDDLIAWYSPDRRMRMETNAENILSGTVY